MVNPRVLLLDRFLLRANTSYSRSPLFFLIDEIANFDDLREERKTTLTPFSFDAGEAEKKQRAQSKRKVPLANLLVQRGFFASLDEAQRWVMAGKVLVNEQRFDKPGMFVACDAVLRVRGRSRYASRGGYKLEAALKHFAIDAMGKVALDCGASTGGFTDCLLQHGVLLVYAVEVGHNQLIGRLRADPRVRNLERTNLSDLLSLSLCPPPTLITLDLSYLSLTQALPIAATILAPQGHILALVKPLYEVASTEARRTGQIENVTLLVEALQRVLETGCSCSLSAQGVVKLALQPRHGVHEFIISFARCPGAVSRCYDQQMLLDIIGGQGIGYSCLEE